MKKERKLCVLVLAADRVIARTLASVLRAGGYMVATTEPDAAAGRIAERIVIDAAVIDVEPGRPIDLHPAVTLHRRYPDCRIVLVCSHSQQEEVVMLAEEASLACQFMLRPLSREELLAQLAAAPGVGSNSRTSLRQLHAA